MRSATEYLSTRQSGPKQLQFVAKLLPVDICDAECPAAAAAVVVLPEKDTVERTYLGSRTLLFCNHHLNRHESKLAELGAAVYRKESK